jgi:hypothetical protein
VFPDADCGARRYSELSSSSQAAKRKLEILRWDVKHVRVVPADLVEILPRYAESGRPKRFKVPSIQYAGSQWGQKYPGFVGNLPLVYLPETVRGHIEHRCSFPKTIDIVPKEHKIAECEADLRARPDKLGYTFQMIRPPQVIAIAERQPWGRRETYARVSGNLNTAVHNLLELDSVAKSTAYLFGIVCRAVVHDNDFIGGKSLCENRFDRFTDKTAALVSRNDDANWKIHAKSFT